MAVFPASVATNSDLYVAVNATSTQLTDNPLTSGATTVNVVDATQFPSVGFISIDNEIIKYTGTTGTSFTGCTRGADGTSATSHVQNSQVFHNVIAAHHNAPKDEIIAIETFLNAKFGTTGGAYTASRALQTNGSGVVEVSAVTTTELGYVSGVTSAIQTQLNAKATDTLVVHLAGSETITGAKTFQDQKLLLQETGGTDVVTINVAALAASRAYTLPDAGASASFVMTEGTQAINGAKTFADSTLKLQETGGSDVVTIAVAALTTSRTYTVPEVSANASFVMTAGTQTISGTKTFDGQLIGKGTATNDNAATGFIGETVESVISTLTNFPATGTKGDLTSISLTAGDWIIVAQARASLNGATMTNWNVGASTTAGNSATGLVNGSSYLESDNPTATNDNSATVAGLRFSLSATTTVYLKYEAAYTAGTPQARGRITAVRIR